MRGLFETANQWKARVRGGRLAGPTRTGHPSRLAAVVGSPIARAVENGKPLERTRK